MLQDAFASTEDVVIKAAEALDATLQRKDIEISHKRYGGKGIIAKFVNHNVKIFPRYPATSSRNHRISLNIRKNILEEANRRKRDRTL